MSKSYRSKNCKQAVWKKGKTIRGKDKNKYCKDAEGNTLYYSSYGKDTKMGWNIDHIKPKSKGGSNNIRNLQPLQTHANKSWGNHKNKPRLKK